ncbi:Bardet-Biedl syndrome 4-like protein [Dinothrombium tinctorium]|uniref:Bardet-Biedl syndrome 4-like protein n=1 Tax=Dinothrombium tinctorium TaxID=1965070 RepID=A0A3S3PD29_9ACAR|nr:Bardet-Biedl syndrome 4-like protein [Dinothrombium tinctorium]RWS12788.1 Bardet-Biedl syndrome 4-like protein [Dinothrombium tinctorium]RWS16770.1 Bardet-Biedl syndrome 4-like protein [Dinothrombium tinctorium]
MTNELKNKESYNWLYHLHYIRGEFETCEKQIQKHNAKSEYASYLIGLIKLRQSDVKGAITEFTSIKSNETTYVKAIARCLMLLGRHSNVCELIRESGLKLSPNDWQLWHILGTAYMHLGQISLAKDAFQHSLQATNQIEPFLLLSQCHLIESDTKSAIFVIRRATELSPNDATLNTKLGLLLFANGMSAKGVDKLMQLSHLSANSPGNLSLALAVGSVLQEIKMDIDGALYRYKMANNFESPCLWNNVAICFASRKKFVAAVSCLKRALYLNTLDWKINYNLGLLNLQLRQFASAFHYLKTAATLSNGLPNVFSLLAICLENLEDDTNARQAHITATKSPHGAFPLPLLNYAIYLHTTDMDRDLAIELLMEYEQCWLKRRANIDFDENMIKTATKLAQALNLSSHMAWTKEPPTHHAIANSINDGHADSENKGNTIKEENQADC